MVQQVGRGRRAHPGMAAGFRACLHPRSPWVGVCGCQGLGLGALVAWPCRVSVGVSFSRTQPGDGGPLIWRKCGLVGCDDASRVPEGPGKDGAGGQPSLHVSHFQAQRLNRKKSPVGAALPPDSPWV